MYSIHLKNLRPAIKTSINIFLNISSLFIVASFIQIAHADVAVPDPRCPKGGEYKEEKISQMGATVISKICTITDSGGSQTTYNPTTGATIARTNAACAGLPGFFRQPVTCIGRTLSVVIGITLITLAAWLLATVGYLFNLLIDYTIVQFGSTLLNTGVRQAIDVGWTALRDLANIIIIAMFVFIAINIILGVKEFGEKKLVARVLIIAVLINFSLLFTNIIVDATNFTALQFVRASGFQTDIQGAQGAFETEFVKKGIAGEFIKFMGLASVGETYKALSNAAFGNESKSYANANGWFALLHGVVSATLLLVAAAILFYACYLLISRAVLLIFLMIISALAFASWLVPQQFVVKGFTKWWESLLKVTFFAPILMIFLWASLNVARAINPQGKGTLGDLVRDPSQTLNLEALFYYIIVIGLLFVSIYTASAFAKSIAWFGAAAMGVGTAARLAGIAGLGTIGLASRFGVAPIWRRTGGRYFARSAMQLGDEIDRQKMAENPDWKNIAKLARAKERRNWLASADFNVMKTSPMKQLAKGLGVGFLGSGHEGGAAEAIKKRADLVAKHAAEMALTAEERNKVRDAAREKATNERERARSGYEKSVEAGKGAVETAKGKVDARESAAAETRFEEAKASKAAKAKAHDDEIARLEKELAEERDATKSTVLSNRIQGMRGRRDSELRAEDENIQKAKAEVDRVQRPIKDAEAALEAATARLKDFDQGSRSWIDDRAKDINEKQTEAITEGIHDVGYRLGRRMPITLQSKTIDRDNLVAEMSRRRTKQRVRLRATAARRRAEVEELDAAGLREEAGGGQGAVT